MHIFGSSLSDQWVKCVFCISAVVPTTQAPTVPLTTPFTHTFNVTSVNSISITVTWLTSTGVGFVQLQFRRLNTVTWTNGTLNLGQHSVHVLTGLLQETTYEIRLLYGLDSGVVTSGIIVTQTCRRGWQGRRQCDTGLFSPSCALLLDGTFGT